MYVSSNGQIVILKYIHPVNDVNDVNGDITPLQYFTYSTFKVKCEYFLEIIIPETDFELSVFDYSFLPATINHNNV